MHYRWEHPDSLIKEAEIYPCGKQMEGIIYAPEGTEASVLSSLTESLRGSGLAVIPDSTDDRPVLRIAGLTRSGTLLSALAQHHATQGEPHVEETTRDHKEHQSFTEKIKSNAVPLAGYAYVAGDAFMMASGFRRNRGLTGAAAKGGASEWATGLTWAAPNLALALFGKKNPEMQTGILLRRVKEYLDNQGIEIPREDEISLEQLMRKDGAFTRIVDFFYEHPTQVNNSVEAAGGLMMMQAGYTQRIGLDQKPNWYKVGAGACVTLGQGGSVLLKEKKTPVFLQAADAKQARNDGESERTEKDDRGVISRSIDWFTEKPLRMAGLLPIGNNILNTVGVFTHEWPQVRMFLGEEGKNNGKLHGKRTELNAALNSDIGPGRKFAAQKELDSLAVEEIKARNYGGAAWLNLASAATFVLANLMYSLGSKDTGVDVKGMGGLDKVYALTARIIAAQPKEHQAELVNRLSGFLASQPDTQDTAENIAHALTTKVRAQEKSPWAQRVTPSARHGQPQQPASQAML